MPYQGFVAGVAAAALSVGVPTQALAQSASGPELRAPDAQAQSGPTEGFTQAAWVPQRTQSAGAPSLRISAQAFTRSGEATRSAALKWELGYLTLSAIDAAQTIDCMSRKDCEEANPLFGKHPSTGKIIAAKVLLGAAHFALFDRLRDKNPRMALRVAQISVALQGTVVGLNARFSFK